MDDRIDDRTEPTELTPAAPNAPAVPVVYRQRRRRILLPVVLFAATCWTTYGIGGLAYSAAVMFILLSHELGHFIQAHRYGVPASLPFFIPIPAPPIGTMGAVIAMQPGVGDRRSIFDIAITGPIAGLIPALIFSIIGLQWSEVIDTTGQRFSLMLGEPLLFKLLAWLTFGPLPEHLDIALHPVAFAGWVGIFITALNLFPIGQLDGGHILYAPAAQESTRHRQSRASTGRRRRRPLRLLGLDTHDRAADAHGLRPPTHRQRQRPTRHHPHHPRLGRARLPPHRLHPGAVRLRHVAIPLVGGDSVADFAQQL